MKKFFAVLILCFAVMVCFGTFPVFAEETTSGATWETPHQGFTDWLNENDIDHAHKYIDTDTHKDEKSLSDLKIKVGAKIEEAIKITDNLRVDIEGKKDVHKTNAKEGWEVESLLVYKKTFLDFSGFFGNK